jgi:hypothetical protein
MKKLLTISLFAALIATGTALKAQEQPKEYLGLPGDNLNLYAVMQLFQNSKTLEDFETSLNDPESNINNLDLNEDNMVDYLRITDNVDGNVHNIVIQDMLSQNEAQDVAVFTVQRFSDGEVQIQLTGDEYLYGKNYIIEPIYDSQGQTPNPGYMGNVTVVTTSPVQIATWPMVRFIYSPSYVVWRSSWHWGYYPNWWHPWRPYYWDYYYGYHHNLYNQYYRHYRRWDTHRYNHWNDYYYSSHRVHSPGVYKRIEAGNYRKTYSHPDQRKKGEAAFVKANPSFNRRASSNSQGNNSSRRTVRSNNNSSQRPTVTGKSTVTRRTTTSVTRTNSANTKPATKATGRSVSQRNTSRSSVSTTRTVTPSVKSRSTRSTTRATTPAVSSRSTRSTTRTTTPSVKSRSKVSTPRRASGISSPSRKTTTTKATKTTKMSKKAESTRRTKSSKPARKK